MSKCRKCKKDIGFETGHRFRDEAAYREFLLLGECQDCQDEAFGVDNRPMTPVEVRA